jgi:Protein of unknown function (DUF2973)
MLQTIYLIAFTILAFLAISNLIRSLVHFGTEAQRPYVPSNGQPVHPEMLDGNGRITSEPLLVMKSINVDDARTRLDALYNDSPSYSAGEEESPN